VFFKDKDSLNNFQNSEVFKDMKDSCLVLTELANQEEKEFVVKNASRQGKVTLLTRNFGRGSDFYIYDESVIANGGLCTI
jgi:3-isopropylmalate dehydratase small subunit